jgi:hypothetical protein
MFFMERDIVWTLQTRIFMQLQQYGTPYRVFNDYPMLPAKHRALSTDIAILDTESSAVEVAVEFKYEPDHQRTDILKNKFPVNDWASIEHDIFRITEFVRNGKAKIGISILIDEGGFFKARPRLQSHKWENWTGNTWVHIAQFGHPYISI